MSKPDLNVDHEVKIGPFVVSVERRKARSVFGRRRREGLRLTVRPDGSLRVTAPLRASQSLVEEFVLANFDWIETQRTKALENQIKNPPRSFSEGEKFRFFGEERALVFEDSKVKRVRVELVEKYLVVAIAENERTKKNISYAITKFFDAQARLHLPERVEYFSSKMGVQPSGLSFRRQKTRWGSCSSRGHISLNWKLLFAPEVVIDYLVVHELAHLVHANHSKRFWDLVKIHDPEYLRHRRWLRDHQSETTYLDVAGD